MLIQETVNVNWIRVGMNMAQFRPFSLFYEDMMPALIEVAKDYGINPLVMVAQSAHETGWGKFPGKVPPSFHNTCGLKIYDPSPFPADDRNSHAQFASWELGAHAHAQHLMAYLQEPLPKGIALADPRWVHVYTRKPAIDHVEELGGSWAPNPLYGNLIVDIINKLIV